MPTTFSGAITVQTADFYDFDEDKVALRASGVRLFGKNDPSVSRDLEPEYIAVAPDGATAYARFGITPLFDGED